MMLMRGPPPAPADVHATDLNTSLDVSDSGIKTTPTGLRVALVVVHRVLVLLAADVSPCIVLVAGNALPALGHIILHLLRPEKADTPAVPNQTVH